jgi:phosphatidylglycerophosphatase A
MIDLLATWFYVGKLKPAPGTWGTLATLPLIWLFNQFGPYGYMLSSVLLTAAAIIIAQNYEALHKGHDHAEVVIDEVVGFVVAMTWLPMKWPYILAAFIIFRALDILKPPPIRQIDQRIPGGLGVVADDLVAGIGTNMVLQLVLSSGWLNFS